jgi:hypothetical protein
MYASNSVFVWHHRNYRKPVDHRWNCNIPIIRAGPVWNKALVMHIHESVKHPPESQQMAYCCFLSSTTNQEFQTDGLQSFYDGSIAMEDIPKNSNTRVAVQLQKAHRPMPTWGKVLRASQLELLHWHFQFGHCSFEQLIKLNSQGHLKLSAAARKATPPKCMSCIMGKAHRRAWKRNKSGKVIRSELDNLPGGQVHIDQLECSQPGLIPQTKGRLLAQGSLQLCDHLCGWSVRFWTYIFTVLHQRRANLSSQT